MQTAGWVVKGSCLSGLELLAGILLVVHGGRGFPSAHAAESEIVLKGAVLDKLGHPVAGARVDVLRGRGSKLSSGTFTGTDGSFTVLSQPSARLTLRAAKLGYWPRDCPVGNGRAKAQLEGIQVRLDRRCTRADILRLETLAEDELNLACLDVLASRPGSGFPEEEYEDTLFAVGEHLRPALRRHVATRPVAAHAAGLLCLMGDPDDVAFLATARMEYESVGEEENAGARIAGALIRPTTEEAWHYIARCLGFTISRRAFEAAASAMAANGSPRACQLLKGAVARAQADGREFKLLADALAKCASGPHPREYNDVDGAFRDALLRIPGTGERRQVDQVRRTPNRGGDKVLVRFRFCKAGGSPLYALSFRKEGGKWTLGGVWRTGEQ
jgi:hypothetical protein